jgi:hypothetical protein
METFQLEPPRIFAERLDTEKLMKRHMADLEKISHEGSYEWDEERKVIIRITYHSAYGTQ